MMDMVPFAALLRDAVGLDAASVGHLTVERAIRERLVVSRMDAPAYLEHLRRSEAEMQQLIESVVVPETWFFRDREAFNVLTRVACEEWLPASPDRNLRVLSLPCSTGEEPYSVSIALLDAGVPAFLFRIDAVDISSRALVIAERATYGRYSFRGTDQAFRERHFAETPGGARLNEAARGQVRFRRGNLFAPEEFTQCEPYDAVFCRNLLIYFDREMQDRSVRLLGQLLRPDGVLFVGPSEAALVLAHPFVSVRVPLAFAFRKVASPPSARPSSVANPIQRVSPSIPPRRSARTLPAIPKVVDPPVRPGLEEVTRLADQGRLVEAGAVCEAYIQRNATSVEALYMMGMIREAGGNHQDAETFYRKALYLDPDHQEALTHLGLLMARQGRVSAARLLRERAKRADRR